MPKTHATYTREDIEGKKFGRLTPIDIVEGHKSLWRCKCDCGNERIIYSYALIHGKARSCGCLEKEIEEKLGTLTVKHGMTDTILYGKWCGIKARCFNPNYKYYDRYGGRGITICDEWQGEHGFENFAKWAYEAGYDDNKKGYEQTIDRINVDGNYCPENCKWSNQVEQVKNRSNSLLIEDTDGEKMTCVQFEKKHGITACMFTYRRIKKGKTTQEILDEWNEYVKCNSGDYLTTKEAAEYYGVNRGTVNIWIRKGLLVSEVVRTHHYIPKGQPRPIFKECDNRGKLKKV